MLIFWKLIATIIGNVLAIFVIINKLKFQDKPSCYQLPYIKYCKILETQNSNKINTLNALQKKNKKFISHFIEDDQTIFSLFSPNCEQLFRFLSCVIFTNDTNVYIQRD